MNIVEFKKGIEVNKSKNINKFLIEYKEEWGETIEDSIDRLLEVYIAEGNSDEPFEVNIIKSRITKEHGEWEDATSGEFHHSYMYNLEDYECQAYHTKVNKKRLFRNIEVEVKRYKKRTKELHKHCLYSGISNTAREYIKKAFRDKGFQTKETIGSNFGRPFIDKLLVYWNDVPIKDWFYRRMVYENNN